MRIRVIATTMASLLGASLACQGYDFVFQPYIDRQGNHLRFVVEQPSKADILFVIDNSTSMTEEQVALADSIDVLLAELTPQDTRYRIGITSTDTIGFSYDCAEVEIPDLLDVDNPGGRGDCIRPELLLRRPHDGTFGRLIAAYDPNIFDLAHATNPLLYDSDGDPLVDDDGNRLFDAALIPVLARALPTGVRTHPAAPSSASMAACSLDTDCSVGGETCVAGLCQVACTIDPECPVPGEICHADVCQVYDFADFDGAVGEAGARWVIDRETVRFEACQACRCTQGEGVSRVCDDQAECYDSCVTPVASKLVEAYFRANLNALGVGGRGYEEGLKAASLAVGIDPEEENDANALDPSGNLLRLPDGANTFQSRDEVGNPLQAPWIRDEALLAVMFVSDEEDCSMPQEIWESKCWFEEGCGDPPQKPPGVAAQPQSSLCYQEDVEPQLLDPTNMARLLTLRKEGSRSRVAVGFIGGVQQVGSDNFGAPADCAVDAATMAPTTTCACLSSPWLLPDQIDVCDSWCAFTRYDPNDCRIYTTPGGCLQQACEWTGDACRPVDQPECVLPPAVPDPQYCDALAGSRYLEFTDEFRPSRRTFESVCRAEAGSGFGEAMARFAQIATLACFELEGILPAGLGATNQASNISVKRVSREDAALGLPPAPLQRREEGASEPGWYYDTEDAVPRICLTGLDRLIGDVYDIFVLSKDELDFSR